MTDPINNAELVNYRLEMIEKALTSISKSLEQLATLEQKNHETNQALGRAFKAIESQDDRIKKIELEMQTLTMVRGWIIAGVVGCAGLLGMTLFKIATIPGVTH